MGQLNYVLDKYFIFRFELESFCSSSQINNVQKNNPLNLRKHKIIRAKQNINLVSTIDNFTYNNYSSV